jgi:hypothetical protein
MASANTTAANKPISLGQLLNHQIQSLRMGVGSLFLVGPAADGGFLSVQGRKDGLRCENCHPVPSGNSAKCPSLKCSIMPSAALSSLHVAEMVVDKAAVVRALKWFGGFEFALL